MADTSSSAKSEIQVEASKTQLGIVSSPKTITEVEKDFINKLHTTLDFHQLINLFVKEVRKEVACDGIEFREDSINLYFVDGNLAQHSSQYEIKLFGQQLGEIRFTRRNVYREDELAQLEKMVAGLIVPLRNSLLYQQAIYLTQRDDLTGLRNGAYFYDYIELDIERSHRYKIPFSMMMIDLDDFQNINENYGYRAGDSVLVKVGNLIKEEIRSCDVVFRNGGDKFILLLPHTDKTEANLVANRIKELILSDHYVYQNNEMWFTVSMGVVTIQPDDTVFKIIDRADKALLHAKTLGKDRIQMEVSSDVKKSNNL